jgi:hypothetical protein
VEADAGHARLVVHGDITAEQVREALADVSLDANAKEDQAAAGAG